jgi:hypothetical protein
MNVDLRPNEDASMNLNWVDPPLDSFILDGVVFDKFYNADGSPSTRNCEYDNTCGTTYIPGQTIKHEFLHILGLGHEHQNNMNRSNPLVFNVERLEEYFIPRGITKEIIQSNILDRYDAESGYTGSDYDNKSIMSYSMGNEFLISGGPLVGYYDFSVTDKEWLNRMYPLNSIDKPVFTVYFPETNEYDYWKPYWIKYVLVNNIEKVAGVKFIFPNLPEISGMMSKPPLIEKSSNDKPSPNLSSNSVAGPGPSPDSGPGPGSEIAKNIVIGIVAIFILYLMFRRFVRAFSKK